MSTAFLIKFGWGYILAFILAIFVATTDVTSWKVFIAYVFAYELVAVLVNLRFKSK